MRVSRRFSGVAWSIVLVAVATGTPRAAEHVYATAEQVQPLAAGARIPVVSLTTVDGKPIDLARAMDERGALLVFYRGGW